MVARFGPAHELGVLVRPPLVVTLAGADLERLDKIFLLDMIGQRLAVRSPSLGGREFPDLGGRDPALRVAE